MVVCQTAHPPGTHLGGGLRRVNERLSVLQRPLEGRGRAGQSAEELHTAVDSVVDGPQFRDLGGMGGSQRVGSSGDVLELLF